MKPIGNLAFLIVATVNLTVDLPVAYAMRIVSLDITVDGKPFLSGSNGDSGSVPKAAVWRYFDHVPLRPREGVVIAPDANDPKRATIRGKIRLEARYGGTADVTELHLVRTEASKNEWSVDRDDVLKIAESIGLGTVPMVLPDHPTGPVGDQAEGEKQGTWVWVIGVVGVIVGLAGLALVLLLRGKPRANPST